MPLQNRKRGHEKKRSFGIHHTLDIEVLFSLRASELASPLGLMSVVLELLRGSYPSCFEDKRRQKENLQASHDYRTRRISQDTSMAIL